MIELHWLQAGKCWAPEFLTVAGGGFRVQELPMMAALLRHPTQGAFLFDTGLAPRIWSATRGFPYRFYRYVIPFSLSQQKTIKEHCFELGVEPEKLALVILSHFHADHTAGLKDFPTAKVLCHADDWNDVNGATGLSALRKASFPALLPSDLEQRMTALGPEDFTELPDSFWPFDKGHDIFADQSCWLVPLPGHSPGQMGLFVETNKGTVLLAADACWQRRSIVENSDVCALVHAILIPESEKFRHSLQQLHQFHKRRPEVPILLSHCVSTQDWADGFSP